MNWLGRSIVHPSPDPLRYRWICSWLLVERNFSGSKPMIESSPENFTMWPTPAFLAASMNVHCVSSIWGPALEIMRTRSTPSSAGPSVSGRIMSPSTRSTVGTASNACALARLLTNALTDSLCRANLRITADPGRPVAPVTKMVIAASSVLVSSAGDVVDVDPQGTQPPAWPGPNRRRRAGARPVHRVCRKVGCRVYASEAGDLPRPLDGSAGAR